MEVIWRQGLQDRAGTKWVLRESWWSEKDTLYLSIMLHLTRVWKKVLDHAGFFLLPSQAWHLPKMLAGASQLSGLSIFHNGVVCFPKQDSIVWKPWHRAYRVQIKVDLHTQAVTKAPRMKEAAWGSRRRTLASSKGRCISEIPPSIPAYWSTARRLIPTRYLSLLGFYPSGNICTEFSRDMHEDVL